MELLEFRTGAAVLVALEDLNVVLQLEFFEKPDDSLCARLLEPEKVLSVAVFLSQMPIQVGALREKYARLSRVTHQ